MNLLPKGLLHSGRDFLRSGTEFCVLRSGFSEIALQNNGLCQNAECKIQNAKHFCILAQPAPVKGFSQTAECRQTYNYVSNRMTRYRGHSVTDLGARSSSAHGMRGDR